jgi:pyrroline-5-carboxylate reductase
MSEIGIIGVGRMGRAIALGLLPYGLVSDWSDIHLASRRKESTEVLAKQGARVHDSAADLFKACNGVVILCVPPSSLRTVLSEIAPHVRDSSIVVSIVAGASVDDIRAVIERGRIARAMPNSAIACADSMTCLCGDRDAVSAAEAIFSRLGDTMVIEERLMSAATSLCASGIAFFCRAIRAASLAGTEIGFSPEQACRLAISTAQGAVSVAERSVHAEQCVDDVCSPGGCTITGLNEMERRGFSSALIGGFVAAHDKSRNMYVPKE